MRVAELKREMSRLGLQVVFESESAGGPLVGFGSEPSDFAEAGVRRALDEIVYAPELAMSGVHVDEIAGGSMVTHER